MIQTIKCSADQMLAICMSQTTHPGVTTHAQHKCSCGGVRSSVILAVHPEICSITVLNTCPEA